MEEKKGTSDEELLSAFAQGEDSGLEELIRRHGVGIKAYAHRLLRNEQDAEEVYVETFAQVFRKRSEIRDQGTARGYLYTIAHRLCLMRFRRRSTEHKHAPTVVAFAGGQSAPYSAEESLTATELAASLEWAIGQLSEAHRQVLLLRTIHGLSTQETADAVGAEPIQIRSQLCWARKRLRALLAADPVARLPRTRQGGLR